MYGFVALAAELAAFGMADNDSVAASIDQHACRDFSCKGAFPLAMKILRRDIDPGIACALDGGSQRSKRWRDDDVAVRRGGDLRCECLEEGARFGGGLIHLPI